MPQHLVRSLALQTRRWPGLATTTLIAVLISAAGASAQANGNAWPQFRRGAAHHGSNPVERVLSPATVSGLIEKWRFTTGGLVTASPAVVNGLVYAPSGDGRVYALDARTGARVWRSADIEAGYPSPAVAGGRVFVGTGVDFGRMYALDAASGAVVWRTAEIGGGMTSPAVAGGRVYVGAGESLYALDAATGQTLWTTPIDSIFSSPAVADGRVYVGGGPDLHALDAATGKIVWSTPLGRPGDGVWSSPAVAGGRVFVGVDSFLADNTFALDAETGAIEWGAYNPLSVRLASPAVAGGTVYIGSTDSQFTALDAQTGAILWRIPIAVYESSPAVANGVVYAGGGNGLYALDAATGAILKNLDAGIAWYSSPVVANGMVYIGSFDGNLYAFGLGG